MYGCLAFITFIQITSAQRKVDCVKQEGGGGALHSEATRKFNILLRINYDFELTYKNLP